MRFAYQYQVPRSRLVEKKWATYKILVDHYFAPLKLPFWIILGYTSLLDKPNSWFLWTPLPSHLPVGYLMIKIGSGRGILSSGICRRTQGPESHLNQPCKWPSFSFWVLWKAPFLNCTNHSLLTLWSNMAMENPRKPATIICSHRQNLPVVIWSVQRFPPGFSMCHLPECTAGQIAPKFAWLTTAAQSVSMAEGSDGSTISSGHIKILPTLRQNQGF